MIEGGGRVKGSGYSGFKGKENKTTHKTNWMCPHITIRVNRITQCSYQPDCQWSNVYF